MLLVTGVRQCGKTTLTKLLIDKDTEYRNLDNQNLLEAAQLDPLDFVTHTGKRMIIDEVQRVPELLLAIKLKVDEDIRPGQFILTGSANVQSLSGVQESLAGQIRKIRLLTLTQGELLGCDPQFLQCAFEKEWPSEFAKNLGRASILEKAFIGGFPEVITFDALEREQWHKDYIDSLLERDMRELLNIRRSKSLKQLVQTMAAWSGKFMNLSAIGSGLEIQRSTLGNHSFGLVRLTVCRKGVLRTAQA